MLTLMPCELEDDRNIVTNEEPVWMLTMRPHRPQGLVKFDSQLIAAEQHFENAARTQRKIVRAEQSAGLGSYVDFGNMDVECRNCRAFRFMAERKVGSSESNPIFYNCWQGGQITAENIPLLQDPPQLLRQLLSGDTPRDKSFWKNIVKYNNALCMASVHANWVNQGEGQ